jgi:hypothetical protein
LAVLVEIGQPFSRMSPDRAMSLTAKPAMSGLWLTMPRRHGFG